MMENAASHSEKTETGLLSAISAEFKFNFIMEFCIAESELQDCFVECLDLL